MIKITAEWNIEHQACPHYPDERLARLYDRPMELRDVLTRKDGPWDDVSTADRLWVFWRAATQDQRAATLDRIVTRAVTNHCLTCGTKVVEQWAARWLSGKDRSGKAAKDAVWEARGGEAGKSSNAARSPSEWAAMAAERATWSAWATTAEAEWAAEAGCAAEAEWAAERAVEAEWAARAEERAAERDLQLLDALAVLDDTETIDAIDAAEGE